MTGGTAAGGGDAGAGSGAGASNVGFATGLTGGGGGGTAAGGSGGAGCGRAVVAGDEAGWRGAAASRSCRSKALSRVSSDAIVASRSSNRLRARSARTNAAIGRANQMTAQRRPNSATGAASKRLSMASSNGASVARTLSPASRTSRRRACLVPLAGPWSLVAVRSSDLLEPRTKDQETKDQRPRTRDQGPGTGSRPTRPACRAARLRQRRHRRFPPAPRDVAARRCHRAPASSGRHADRRG
jgi:hypothetical protein